MLKLPTMILHQLRVGQLLSRSICASSRRRKKQRIEFNRAKILIRKGKEDEVSKSN